MTLQKLIEIVILQLLSDYPHFGDDIAKSGLESPEIRIKTQQINKLSAMTKIT